MGAGVNKIMLIVAGLAMFGGAIVAHAEERADHFKGKQAETVEQALVNFVATNAELEALLKQDVLTPLDIHQVHVMTYTLENALIKIRAGLEVAAETLEAVHVASESADGESVREQGSAYLNSARRIIK